MGRGLSRGGCRTFCVVVEAAGDGGFEAGEVGAAIDGADVVGEAEDEFVVGVVVLEGDVDGEPGFLVLAREGDDLVEHTLVVVEVFDEGLEPFVEAEGFVLDLPSGPTRSSVKRMVTPGLR